MRFVVQLTREEGERVLSLFKEIETHRELLAVEVFLRLIFKDALDKASHGM